MKIIFYSLFASYLYTFLSVAIKEKKEEKKNYLVQLFFAFPLQRKIQGSQEHQR